MKLFVSLLLASVLILQINQNGVSASVGRSGECKTPNGIVLNQGQRIMEGNMSFHFIFSVTINMVLTVCWECLKSYGTRLHIWKMCL